MGSSDKKTGKKLRIKTVFRYVNESFSIIKQGYKLSDKFILFVYFLRAPITIVESLVRNKSFREIEEQHKFLPGNVTIKNIYGIFYCGNNILTIHSINETTEQSLYPFFKTGGGCFIDVGAYIGKYSIMMGLRNNNPVVAIEADKYNFSLLEKNKEQNKLSNLICINRVLYSSKMIIPFYFSDQGDDVNSLVKPQDIKNSIDVETDTLDNILDEISLHSKIDLIKIDAEGAEIEILKGATNTIKNNRPCLIVEVLRENKKNKAGLDTFAIENRYSITTLDADNYLLVPVNEAEIKN